MNKQYVTIVNITGFYNKWRPFVCELSRDCPKTIFTKSQSSELRWLKKEINYQLFDSKEEANKAFNFLVRDAIASHASSIVMQKELKEYADRIVKTALRDAEWLGGSK